MIESLHRRRPAAGGRRLLSALLLLGAGLAPQLAFADDCLVVGTETRGVVNGRATVVGRAELTRNFGPVTGAYGDEAATVAAMRDTVESYLLSLGAGSDIVFRDTPLDPVLDGYRASGGSAAVTCDTTGPGGTTSVVEQYSVAHLVVGQLTPDAASTLTVDLSAAPETLALGASSTLSWTSSNALGCTASGAWSGARPPSGTETITPTATGSQSYTLSCAGNGGATGSDTVTVTVQAAGPVIDSFVATPAQVAPGANLTLSWAARNVDGCTASGDWSGTLPVQGEQTLNAGQAGTRNYTLSCSGPGGLATQTLSVQVSDGGSIPSPVIDSFTATPEHAQLGQSVQLDWSSSNTSSCTASGDWSGAQPVDGSFSLTPQAVGTLTFTLSCSDGSATTSQQLSVPVSEGTVTATSGGGASGPLLLIPLALLALRRRRALLAGALALSPLAAAAQDAADPAACKLFRDGIWQVVGKTSMEDCLRQIAQTQAAPDESGLRFGYWGELPLAVGAAGIYRSDNGGRSWTPLAVAPPAAAAIPPPAPAAAPPPPEPAVAADGAEAPQQAPAAPTTEQPLGSAPAAAAEKPAEAVATPAMPAQPAARPQSADGLRTLYVGLRAGVITTDISDSTLSRALHDRGESIDAQLADDSDIGGALYLGWQPVPRLAVEIGYQRLGEFKAELSGAPVDADAATKGLAQAFGGSGHGLSVAARYFVPLAEQFDVAPRAGLYAWRTEIEIDGPQGSSSVKENGTGYLLGASFGWLPTPQWRVALGGEWQRPQSGVSQLQYGVEVEWRFAAW